MKENILKKVIFVPKNIGKSYKEAKREVEREATRVYHKNIITKCLI